jgi:hypothetical protein
MSKEQRLMTDAEKEQCLKRVKIETEDVPQSNKPEDVFAQTLKSYQDGMKEQIENLNKLLSVQYKMKAYAEILYSESENELDKDTLKTELASREDIIAKARSSAAIMQERIAIGETLHETLVKNYNLIADLDFYFGGVMNMPETTARVQRVVEDNVKK